MPDTPQTLQHDGEDVGDPYAGFYRRVMQTLSDAGVPFLVGGAFSFACFTGIRRHTKDLDLFIRREDYERIEQVVAAAGFRTDLAYPHWLAKIHEGDAFVDLIFNSGNGVTVVDDEWFQHALRGEVLGLPVLLAPAEESLWSKAFIMERERYDGADVAHLLRACAAQLDWTRLLRRFGAHWRVLLSHLVLFGFIYPDRRDTVPRWVMDTLLERLRAQMQEEAPQDGLCAGTLLSREQYLHDVEQQGLQDGRVEPFGSLTPREVAEWTEAIPGRQPPPEPAAARSA